MSPALTFGTWFSPSAFFPPPQSLHHCSLLSLAPSAITSSFQTHCLSLLKSPLFPVSVEFVSYSELFCFQITWFRSFSPRWAENSEGGHHTCYENVTFSHYLDVGCGSVWKIEQKSPCDRLQWHHAGNSGALEHVSPQLQVTLGPSSP